MIRKVAKIVLPLVVLAIIAALTIGLDGNCQLLGNWAMPAT